MNGQMLPSKTTRWLLCWILALAAGIVTTQPAQAQIRPLASLFGKKKDPQHFDKMQAAAQVPLSRLPPNVQPKVAQVLEKPTLFTQGPAEKFLCQPNYYYFFLDNPDRTMTAWRRLGASCIEIANRGNGTFGWTDDKGSDVHWYAVYKGPKIRIWYAEGQVKPTALLPMIPVQAVVILHHHVVQPKKDGALMHQQAEVFVRTESRAASIVTRLLGPSVPRMAKDAAAQMQMFFAAMAWYCQQNPERVKELLRPPEQNERANERVLSPFQMQNSQPTKHP